MHARGRQPRPLRVWLRPLKVNYDTSSGGKTEETTRDVHSPPLRDPAPLDLHPNRRDACAVAVVFCLVGGLITVSVPKGERRTTSTAVWPPRKRLLPSGYILYGLWLLMILGRQARPGRKKQPPPRGFRSIHPGDLLERFLLQSGPHLAKLFATPNERG